MNGERKKWEKFGNYQDTVQSHLHIVLGGEHYNPLGIIRSLGEAGLKPIAIITKGKKRFVGSSKYIDKVTYVNDVAEGIQHLIGSIIFSM